MSEISFLQDKINKALEQLDFNKEPKELYEPIKYSLSMGGKRIRPLLALLACEMFRGNISDAINPAIGLEIFHNFTLIHDDIMDKAPLRRGKETVYRKWNPDIAILSGDTMFAFAYLVFIKTNPAYLPSLLEAFNQAAIEVCEGQQLDMNFESRLDVSIPEYINMIRLKTAALIAASLKIGALAAAAEKENAEHIYKFGENIGIAFQIMDDLLDVYGDTAKFGKASCGDIKTNKKTYLFLKAKELAGDATLKELNLYYSEQFTDEALKVQKVKEIYDRLQIKNITVAEIESYSKLAFRHLDAIKLPTIEKEPLRDFALKLMDRQF